MSERYIYDALYGPIYLPDYVWDIITCPELQRLREIRLCNINSLCLPGGANINRFEHAIGTCHLAQLCIKEWPALNPIYEKEQRNLIIAALFHDATSGPFGHSFEYLEDFNHEKGLRDIEKNQTESKYEWKGATFETVFFGLSNDLFKRINQSDYDDIGKTTEGKGRMGKLLNSAMDLDNIDNVYRLAYHIGIINSTDTPLKLAKSLWIEDENLTIKKDAIPLIKEWHEVRKKLYTLLLLNPEEFAAKCMLTDAIELAKNSYAHSFNWFDTDYTLINKLYTIKRRTDILHKGGISNTEIIQKIAQRLMTGDLYGCAGIYSSTQFDLYNELLHSKTKAKLEEIINEKLKASKIINRIMRLDQKIIKKEKKVLLPSKVKYPMVSIHPIKDVNKTERQVDIHTETGEEVTVGNRVDRLLVGVFFKNLSLNLYKTDKMPEKTKKKIEKDIREVLGEELNDPTIISLRQHGEINEI